MKIFSTDGVKILNTCIIDFCVTSVVWSVQVHALFMVFNLCFGLDFIFEPCS
jgi:hypothetical protein